MLVKFYNIIINECYYPERWLNILDVMIEKELQIIQLIEADLQLLIRIFLLLQN